MGVYEKTVVHAGRLPFRCTNPVPPKDLPCTVCGSQLAWIPGRNGWDFHHADPSLDPEPDAHWSSDPSGPHNARCPDYPVADERKCGWRGIVILDPVPKYRGEQFVTVDTEIGPVVYEPNRHTGHVFCPDCGRSLHVNVKPLRATTVSERRCDGRCRDAMSDNCQCACGGEHHGESWIIR